MDSMEAAALQNKNTQELVCKAFANDLSKYCSIIVAIHSILTMEVTRRAFMSLPYPDSPDYVIPDNSMTAIIHSFFLRRQRPQITGDDFPNDADQCNDKLRRIAKWLQKKCPDLFYFAEEDGDDQEEDELEDDMEEEEDDVEEDDDEDGSEEEEDAEDEEETGEEDNEQLGGEPVVALRNIVEKLIKEGYVKGLKEDLCGKYTTRLTCKKCGSSCSVRHKEDTIATFGTPDEKLDFFKYLKLHSSEAHEFELQEHLNNALQASNNETTRFLNIQHLFTFAERITRLNKSDYCPSDHFRHSKLNRHKKLKKRISCKDKDVRFRTTIDHFPHTLIVDVDYVQCLGNIRVDEFIDLSELAENASTTNAKYKLVLVVETVDDGRHCIAYVRASKYVNGNSSVSSNIDMENMWYKLNDHNLELVPFSEVLKAPEHILFIYEQEQS